MIEITDKKINTDKVIQSVVVPETGAVDVFIGTTRNHSNGKQVVKLEYEAYSPMALKKMEQLISEVRKKWDIQRAAIVHRIGEVAVGQASVVIAVSSSHREEAFVACRYLIDRLKEIVPIWKREYFKDGSVEWSKATHSEK